MPVSAKLRVELLATRVLTLSSTHVPAVTVPVLVGTWVWMLAAMVVAVRQALDYETIGRAVAVCLLGWVLALTIAVGLGMIFGPSVS